MKQDFSSCTSNSLIAPNSTSSEFSAQLQVDKGITSFNSEFNLGNFSLLSPTLICEPASQITVPDKTLKAFDPLLFSTGYIALVDCFDVGGVPVEKLKIQKGFLSQLNYGGCSSVARTCGCGPQDESSILSFRPLAVESIETAFGDTSEKTQTILQILIPSDFAIINPEGKLKKFERGREFDFRP